MASQGQLSQTQPAAGLVMDKPRERLATGWSDMLAPAFILCGLAAWGYGLSRVTPSNIRQFGLLFGTNLWLPCGVGLLLVAYFCELVRGTPRNWVLALNLVGLIVAIYAAIPIVFGAPEYAWVYKHIGIISSFQRYGRTTDPTNIYDQWPTLFAGVALISSLAHVNAVTFAQWAPLAFELANALLFVGIARSLINSRRTVWLAALLYEGFVAWVGQDYLSPQAFGYLLWLGLILMILRCLRAPIIPWKHPRWWTSRIRGWLTDGIEQPHVLARGPRIVVLCAFTVVYFALVTAHQLTPYMAIPSVAGLVVVDVIRPRWILLLVIVGAGGFLALHYQLVVNEYGGLFGGDPLTNATVRNLTSPSRVQFLSSRCVDLVAAMMWLLSLGVLASRLKRPGPVLIPGILAFAPFGVLLASSYGGEAVYRVFLFSAPWCAILIAGGLVRLTIWVRWIAIVGVSVVALMASLQSLYGSALADSFTPSELAASEWLYSHIPNKTLIVLPSDNFPTLETSRYADFDLQVMPADPLSGPAWLNEGHLNEVATWLRGLGHHVGYVVVSRSMNEWRNYYGVTRGYNKLTGLLQHGLWSARPVYKNRSTTIYRVNIVHNVHK